MTMSPDELSPEADAAVRRALHVDEPMPPQVWARLQAALAAEEADQPATRSATAHGGSSRWLPGLAAAAVLVIAGALVWPNLQPDAAAPVAASAPQVATAEAAQDGAARMAAPANAAPVSPLATSPLAVGPVPMLESGTDYRSGAIDDSVIRLASNVVPDDTPTAGDDGFTATADGINDCLGALLRRAESPNPEPLVIDRATLDGLEIGLLVLAPTGQRYEVFVVDLGCSAGNPGIRLHRWVSAP